MTTKYLPKWAEDEMRQLKAKIEGLEVDNAKLRGEITGTPWVFAPSRDVRIIEDLPILGGSRRYRKIEVGEGTASHRWQVQLSDDTNELTIRCPWDGNGTMAVIPEASNTIRIAMVKR